MNHFVIMLEKIKGWTTEKLYIALVLPLYAIWDKLGFTDDSRMEDENEIYIDYIKHYGWLRPNTTVQLKEILPYADWKEADKLAGNSDINKLYHLLDSWVKERQLNLHFPFIHENNIKVVSEYSEQIILPWLQKWKLAKLNYD